MRFCPQDLRLPAWGPYNKRYLGASHVTDPALGLRFDVNLFPGFYQRSLMIPRDVADCGAKAMHASVDLSYFCYRYELEWRDQVYIDAEFRSDGADMHILCHCRNRTDQPQTLSLNALMSIHACSFEHRESIPLAAHVGEGCRYIDAVDHAEAVCGGNIPADGLRRGERRGDGFVGGGFLSHEFFCREGHRVCYRFAPTATDAVGIRYRNSGDAAAELLLTVGDTSLPVSLPPSDGVRYEVVTLPTGTAKAAQTLRVEWRAGKADIDGFVLGGEEAVRAASFEPAFDGFSPTVTPCEGGAQLWFGRYGYRVRTSGATMILREIYSEDPGVVLESSIHSHVQRVFGDRRERKNVDFFLRPIFLDAMSEQTLEITVTALTPYDAPDAHENVAADPTPADPVCNPAGERYRVSQTVIGAITLTNVVYPIYCNRAYIRHNTPGRQWDSLYTWDSGFIGMGLATKSLARATDCLNTYLPPADAYPDGPYIQHGTPLPTQILLMAEIFSRGGDMAFLREFYPRARRQYRFIADRRTGPRAQGVGIFNLWDVFYNSGGWDDYPTQVLVHKNHLEDCVSPVVNTAMTALCARILRGFARLLGEPTVEYDADIEAIDHALNTRAWDEPSGYYGYVRRGEDGSVGILYDGGVNADMGMDGVYPYVAGVCPDERAARLLDNVRAGMMTPYGVSVVDVRAPYYSREGYWNGAIWMPHQWILWKALLDHGECGLAWDIARTGLEVWEREVSLTYNCYECFLIQNGRGVGFHQFSGLSTPVLLMWFEAYFRPFTVTGGFRAVITDRRQEGDAFSFRLRTDAPAPCVLLCLPENLPPLTPETENVTATPMVPGTWALRFTDAADVTVRVTPTADRTVLRVEAAGV